MYKYIISVNNTNNKSNRGEWFITERWMLINFLCICVWLIKNDYDSILLVVMSNSKIIIVNQLIIHSIKFLSSLVDVYYICWYLYYMGRLKIKDDDKKTKVSVALDPELLKFYRSLHINLSSLVNKLLKDYKDEKYKNL